MKKKLIIYGVNHYPPRGGTSRVVENLILQLKNKYDITVYCYKNDLAKRHLDGVNVVEFRPLTPGSIGSLFYFFMSALHILLFGKADVIHAHKTDCALFIPLLRLRFKVVATSHEAPYKRDKWNNIQKAYFHLAERVFIKSASICTCISEPLTKYYEKKYKVKVHFIPNGINVTNKKDFDFKKAESFIPPEASLDQPFILFSARRLMATKGCHTMLAALKQAGYEGQVFITGELDGSSYVKKLQELSTGLNVHYLGYVDPLSALLALVYSCKIFIFPSETEGMSIMLLEAASTGKPIIASDIPENTQVFSGDEVLYFESRNVDDLALKISQALSDHLTMETMGLNAQQKVFSNYLWSSIAQYYDHVFKSLISPAKLEYDSKVA